MYRIIVNASIQKKIRKEESKKTKTDFVCGNSRQCEYTEREREQVEWKKYVNSLNWGIQLLKNETILCVYPPVQMQPTTTTTQFNNIIC